MRSRPATPGLLYAWLLVGAWRGVEAEAMKFINAGLENATARSEGRVVALAGYATAVLNNGLGRYEAAMDGAKRASDDGDFGYSGAALPELVEAATRCWQAGGRRRRAAPAGGADTRPPARIGRSESWHAHER